jgi:flagellar operon protein
MNLRQLAARTEPGAGVEPRGSPPEAPAARDPSRVSFAEQLRRARAPADTPAPELKLSAHARQRIAQRGISMTEAEHQTLCDAVQQLEARGARDALLLREDAAFVVNVPTRTLVTAMAQDELRDRIFTQIDSAMLV